MTLGRRAAPSAGSSPRGLIIAWRAPPRHRAGGLLCTPAAVRVHPPPQRCVLHLHAPGFPRDRTVLLVMASSILICFLATVYPRARHRASTRRRRSGMSDARLSAPRTSGGLPPRRVRPGGPQGVSSPSQGGDGGVVGVSGAGKTTLLQILGTSTGHFRRCSTAAATCRHSRGEMAAFRNRSVGFVFQFHNLLRNSPSSKT